MGLFSFRFLVESTEIRNNLPEYRVFRQNADKPSTYRLKLSAKETKGYD
nr:MAG TPA: hypothetical protein [Caudoviricetes sp.]